MEKKIRERGAISVAVAFVILITSLVGIVAGYKAVQQPTRTTPKAQTYTCETMQPGQLPNRRCSETLPGPCTYGDWQYQCTGNRGPCSSDAGVGVPYWCDGSVWHNMNWMGECTTQCQPATQPTTPPGGGGGSTGSGGCFYLTAQISEIGDVWVTFNPSGSPPITGDIELIRNGVGVAGPNRWFQSNGPFTYHPGTYGPYQKVPLGSSVTFTGRMDACLERGNRSDITCSLSADGSTVSGAGCSKYGEAGNQIPPTQSPTTQPPPAATAIPTPTSPAGRINITKPVYPTIRDSNINPSPQIPGTGSRTLIPTPKVSPEICDTTIKDCLTPTPTSRPTPNIPVFSDQNPIQSIKNIITRNIPLIEGNKPTPIQQPTSISGKVKVNNTIGVKIDSVAVLLYLNKEDQQPLMANAIDGEYAFDGLENKNYIVKAWVRDGNGQWYQNRPCTAVGDNYDCIVKPGEKKNLEVDIGPQGLRAAVIKTQETSQKAVKNVSNFIDNIPIVGPLIQMFIISAF